MLRRKTAHQQELSGLVGVWHAYLLAEVQLLEEAVPCVWREDEGLKKDYLVLVYWIAFLKKLQEKKGKPSFLLPGFQSQASFLCVLSLAFETLIVQVLETYKYHMKERCKFCKKGHPEQL